MKLPTSNRTSSFGKKPLIKKGYYPAKLLKVEEFADKDGNLILGTYGNQLIFEFAVYESDDNDTPIKPIMFIEKDKSPVEVKISKFAYHQYKDKENPGKFQTAITPNSAITKLLVALGWTFTEDGVDPDDFIGKWAEVNINDFETKSKDGERYTASTIADVSQYKGNEVSKDIAEVKATRKPQSVEKQITGMATLPSTEDKLKLSPIAEDDTDKIRAKIENLNKLNKDGHLTDEGHKQAIEQLQAKLDLLTK